MTTSRCSHFGYPLCMILPIPDRRTLARLSLFALFLVGCGATPEPGDDDAFSPVAPRIINEADRESSEAENAVEDF